jgi:Ca2+-binding EF-hand superfamily protein|tara:strand:- start:403 stop:1047 length:645 start_codon:yes stop_codon:yes gene_type:complete
MASKSPAAKGRPGKDKTGKSPAGAVAKVPEKPKWQLQNEEAKKCFISDEQLQQAKEAFFRTDKDGSGSIDREELGFMLKSLGQNPTEAELSKMMREADRGGSNEEKFEEGGNGKIEMREFLKWYGAICNEGGANGNEDQDVTDAYFAFGPKDKETPIAKDKLQAQLLEDFGLEIDVDSLFIGSVGNEISHDAFSQMVAGSLANPRHIAQRVTIT